MHIDNTTDYTTNGYIMVLQQFVAIKGCPTLIYSENGSQLKAAPKQMKSIMKELDWETLSNSGVRKGTTWRFTYTDTPWHNGYAEAALLRSTRTVSCTRWETIFSPLRNCRQYFRLQIC